MSAGKREASRYQLAVIRRFASNPLLTHMGEVRCNMLTGALVPRWGTVAGVPGPRRSADERDAGWFAPVATRRRPFIWRCIHYPARLLIWVRPISGRCRFDHELFGLAELDDRHTHHRGAHDRHDAKRHP